jgi:hypothetical protein
MSDAEAPGNGGLSDYEVLRAMIARAQARGGMMDNKHPAKIDYDNEKMAIVVHAGYIGFVTHLEFDREGKLLGIEAYE